MREENQESGRRKLTGEVRGRVRSALMGWTDPVTGDRLRVTVKGENGLVEALEPLGFERLDGEEDSAPASVFEKPKEPEEHRAPASVVHARIERRRPRPEVEQPHSSKEPRVAG